MGRFCGAQMPNAQTKPWGHGVVALHAPGGGELEATQLPYAQSWFGPH